MLRVSIEIDPDDWDTLRHQTRTFDDLMAEIEKYNLSRPFASIYDWFSATVTIDGETHAEVGVRKKGFLGSQSDTKPSLKLRYDKYVDGQSLGGVMERMTLNNSIQDPSMVNTCLSYQVFAAAGSPASRCNFATVTVNGKELGLYVHVEEIKAPMLARHFDSSEGNLYEGTVSDFTPQYRGTMEKKTNEDEDDWSDVDAVMAALLDPSESGLEELAEWVDLDRFLSFWATEVLVGHWDGYAGDRNNYHFYREPDGKFVFIPWGTDDVFHLKDDPNPFDNISNPPPSVLALTAIPNRLYNIPDWRVKYAERLKDILDSVWDEDELLASVDAMAAIVQEHALREERAKAAEDTGRVRKFILKRRGEILADLTPEPPDWPEPDYGGEAASGVESFELGFETTWGTNGSTNPLAEGTVYELTEGGEWVAAAQGEAGATAGPASPQEEADIGVDNAALFTVMGLYPDGAIRGVTFWMPVDRVVAGAMLTISMDADVGGAIWTVPAGGSAPEGFIPVTAGAIELTEAGTEPGAAIAATIYVNFGDGQMPDGGSATDGTVSGSVEVEFETAWGSNKSLDPFAAGGSVSYLAVDEVEESYAAVAVIGGHAGPDESALLPGLGNLASLTVIAVQLDGSVGGMTLVMLMEMLASGATLVIGQDTIAGGVWTLPPGGAVPDNFWPFIEGTLTLREAGTGPNAPIAGSFSGVYGDASNIAFTEAGGDLSPGAPIIELRFVTTFGSLEGTDPIAAGSVTEYKLNGIDIPIGESGAIAGLASPYDAEDLGLEEAVSITIVVPLPDGTSSVFGVWLPPVLMESGANLTIWEDGVGAFSLRELPSGMDLGSGFFDIISGSLKLEEASLAPGAKIAGSLHVAIGSLSDTRKTVPANRPDWAIVINEVAAKGDPFDWFELHNSSDSTVTLANFVVADDLADAGKRVTFPSGLVVAPGGYLRVEVDSDNWAGFKLGGDEELGVWTSEGVLVDSVDWDEGDSGEGESYARVPDGTGEFQTVGNPTPGAANQP